MPPYLQGKKREIRKCVAKFRNGLRSSEAVLQSLKQKERTDCAPPTTETPTQLPGRSQIPGRVYLYSQT
jgi:hypothetical protein